MTEHEFKQLNSVISDLSALLEKLEKIERTCANLDLCTLYNKSIGLIDEALLDSQKMMRVMS
jgi:hypothetical protein